MSSEAAVKEQIKKVRREVQLSHDSKSLLRTLTETQRCLDRLAGQPSHTLFVAHVLKELVDWVALKDDQVLESTAGKECLSLFEKMLSVCCSGEKSIRSFLLSRLYNAMASFSGKDKCVRLKLLIARQMNLFPIESDVADLFVRVKCSILKTVYEKKGKPTEELQEYADLVIELHRKLLIYEAGKARTKSESTRTSALALFGELFDNRMAILYRLYSFNHTKGQRVYRTIMDTMRDIVKPNEQELISLLQDSVGYVEIILAYTDEQRKDYGRFAEFLTLFDAIRTEPYTECSKLIGLLVQFVQCGQPTGRQLDKITTSVRTLQASWPSHPLVVKVAIFVTCESYTVLSPLSQQQAVGVSKQAIGLCEALMHFVRHCPSETVPELCRTCTSPRRHLADKLLGMLIHFNTVQAKDAADRKLPAATLSYSINRGCELIKRKLDILEDFTCERKQSLIDYSMRYGISWLKSVITLQLMPNGSGNSGKAVEEGAIILSQTLKLLITVQNRYRFDYLSDMYFVRLLENIYTDRAGSTAVTVSCWPNVSVRLLKLLLTLRDTSSGTVQENATAISAVVRSIMSCQVNAPADDPIRSLTILQLYEHKSFDRYGFAFNCVPSRAEKFTILAEEMTLAAKYKTSNTIPCWEYVQQLAMVGDIREHCLTFGIALHSFGENDFGKLPERMVDTLLDALKAHRPANAVERVKRFASLGIMSYHAYILASRAVTNRLRDLPFKVEQLRNGQIDEFLLENQLDREAEKVGRMEAIRNYFTDLVTALEEDNFRSLWVLPSVAQISSILDNTARLYHLHYQPHRAVELQLLNLRLVSQRQDVRPLDQCSSLVLLLEQHELTDAILKDKGTAKKTVTTLASLEDLAKRATSLLPPAGSSIDNVPDNRKFQLLNLYLALAVYYASLGEFKTALLLLHRTQNHLNKSTNVETIAELLQGRTAQIIFRLATEYGLPWPDSVPPIALMKRMLASFNELQRLPSEHSFSLSLSTVEMTVAVLQYLIARYNAGPPIEPHVDQMVKFLLRRGAGLRVVQLLLLYGQMCADMQKLDRVEIVLDYLNRLLMLQPILSEGKENGKLTNEAALLGRHKVINSVPFAAHGILEELVDVGREAAPKNRIVPTLTAWDGTTGNKTIAEQYLMFHHAAGCDCRYCSFPQYKSMAFQTGALTVRLAVLQRTKPPALLERSYVMLCQHLRTEIFPTLVAATFWAVPAYRTELVVAVIRMLLNRGQFLVLQKQYDAARDAYRWASELNALITEPALLADIRYNLNALAFTINRPAPEKRNKSAIQTRYSELLAKMGKANDGCVSPEAEVVTTNLTKLTIHKTPAVAGRTTRAPPRTVDRVNELIRQAALLRHQRKSPGKDVLLVPDGTVPNRTYSASARKPKSVNIFVDSPPNRSAKVNAQVPATVNGKIIKPSSTARVKVKAKALEAEVVVDLTKNCDVGKKDGKVPGSSRRGGKRDLISVLQTEAHDPVTPKRAADSYKDALLSGTPTCTPPPGRSVNKKTGRKVRRLVDDFPSLSDSSDTDASTKPSRTKPLPTDSPALNGSFRDVLVLGDGAKANDSSAVIVLDDTESDKSHQSDDAIDTSIVQSHAVSADKRAGLSLMTYSARKRLLGSGPMSGTSSSAARLVAAKRRTPLLASKTKLRFDDPSPEQPPNGKKEDFVADEAQAIEKKKMSKNARNTAASVANGKTSERSRTKKVMDPPAVVPPIAETEKVEPRMSTIASRTRLRRKRI